MCTYCKAGVKAHRSKQQLVKFYISLYFSDHSIQNHSAAPSPMDVCCAQPTSTSLLLLSLPVPILLRHVCVCVCAFGNQTNEYLLALCRCVEHKELNLKHDPLWCRQKTTTEPHWMGCCKEDFCNLEIVFSYLTPGEHGAEGFRTPLPSLFTSMGCFVGGIVCPCDVQPLECGGFVLLVLLRSYR